MKYIQSYFECFKESGMKTVFEVHRMQGDSKIEAHSFDHVDYDGVSALTEIARRFPADGFKSPALSLKPKPGIIKRLIELFRWYVRFYPFMPSKWKNHSRPQDKIISAVLEVPDWKLDTKNVSINTLLLWSLDQTSLEWLENADSARVWMTPVGLYDGIDRNVRPANRVSFIDLKIKNDSTPISVQQDAKTQLRDLNYWGTILTMYFSVFFGKWLFTKFAKYLHLTFRRTGTFSNLGEWVIPGIPENEWWVFGEGCVARMSPVEGTALVVNGRLGLSVHFHESLGINQEEANQFIQKWRKNYLAATQKHAQN